MSGRIDQYFRLSNGASNSADSLADCSLLPLVNAFPVGWQAVLLIEWRIRWHVGSFVGSLISFVRLRLSRYFVRRITRRMAQRMARQIARRITHYIRSTTAFPKVCMPWCSPNGAADGSADGSMDRSILPLVDGFPYDSRAVVLDGWHFGSFVGSLISSACRCLY